MHILILKSFDELSFNLGKKTFIDFLKGNPNPTIDRNNLDELNSYGILYKNNFGEIEEVLDKLIKHKFLEINVVNGKFKVLMRTNIGMLEIKKKTFDPTKGANLKINSILNRETQISELERKIFKNFDFFLGGFNDEQKKAIISNKPQILTIAGAGSGKTSVLTKRIEFLVKFSGVLEKEILAVTFTKKAKEEMQKRLDENKIYGVVVETFNSFCEKNLIKNGAIYYGREVKVLAFKNKIRLTNLAFKKLGFTLENIAEDYFNKRVLKEKSKDELFFIFVNDIFSIIDFYKNHKKEISKFYELEKNGIKKKIAKWIYEVCVFVSGRLKQDGFRDFSDQILDSLDLFKRFQNKIPQFKHILIDEFQDVNKPQFDLLKKLNSENLFVVGDPRQAIYGWRGSDIKYILEFNKHFPEVEVINLKLNYRSSSKLVDFFNLAIKPLGLIDLKSGKLANDEAVLNSCAPSALPIFLIENESEMFERQLVLESIKNSKNMRNEIFILARTNRVLNSFADFFNQNGMPFAIKSEEDYRVSKPAENQVILATVHSIKGMEAEEVYLVGCNSNSFPNKVPDNFVFALAKNFCEYDKDNEELRLFYVALSRAKSKLVITFAGNYSRFITDKMLEMTNFKSKNRSLFDFGTNSNSKNLNTSNSGVLRNLIKDWRLAKSNNLNLPLYMIISNKAIDDLVVLKPQTKAEMFNVNGIGESKIAKYGEELLKIING